MAEIIDEARVSGVPVGLSRPGKRAAVILSTSLYEALEVSACLRQLFFNTGNWFQSIGAGIVVFDLTGFVDHVANAPGQS